MDIYTLQELLSSEKLHRVRELCAQAKWVDGRLSGGDDTNKHNEEVTYDSPLFLDIAKLVESAFRESEQFHSTAWPRYMTRPIVSRYRTGMFYKAHTDFPVANFFASRSSPAHRAFVPMGNNYVRTDLSITLFLSDLDSYGGGELCFDAPTGPLRYRLPAGGAVLYPTGVPHSVSAVTHGERLAAIFWVQSLFQLEPQRRAVHDAYHLYKAIGKALPGSREHEQAEVNFHNVFRLLAAV